MAQGPVTQGPGAPGKKGLSPLAWVAIGCGALLVLGGIALAVAIGFVGHKVKQVAGDMEDRPVETTAKLFARVNPDVDYVDSDEDARTVTLRNTKTGEEMTFDFKDIEQGKLRWNTGEGEVEIDAQGAGDQGGVTVRTEKGTAKFGAGAAGDDELPAWVPVCEDSTAFDMVFVTEDTHSRTGTYTVSCPAAINDALDFYQQALEGDGFEVKRQTVSFNGGKQGILTGENKADERTVVVTLTSEGEGAKGGVQYSEKH